MRPIDAGALKRLTRSRCHGVLQILRFNWPFYAMASVGVAAAAEIARLPLSLSARLVLCGALAPAAWWLLASLLASWIVYDRSPLMDGDWIAGAVRTPPRRWIHVHAGFDEMTAVLRAQFDGARGRTFDIFDPTEMTEPSIARARRSARPDGACEHVDTRSLPVATASVDAAFLLMSAHELRTTRARDAFFAEIRRALGPTGCAIVAEHLRDAANFLAFGPGFLHFHSRRTWRRTFARTGLAIRDEFAITPFVRIFVLERSQ